jgi:predicted AAA+ superfamily ATPase
MIERPFWINRIEEAWKEASIVWLAGVRRAGKTTLVQSLGEDRILYVNCDLPVASSMTADPELFFRDCGRPVVVFDEIHRLPDPSMVLKIGADLFPELKIIATGSSTLAASRKFKDTLTGRKRVVRLTPALWDELPAFNAPLSRGSITEVCPKPFWRNRNRCRSTASGWIRFLPVISSSFLPSAIRGNSTCFSNIF